MALSEKKAISNRRYDEAHYDQLTVKAPKGTKDFILSHGYVINVFINEAIKEKIERMEK